MDKYSKFLHENYDAIIARVKIISKLDIAERRKFLKMVPQHLNLILKKLI